MLSYSDRLPNLWYTDEVVCNSSCVVRYPAEEGAMVRRRLPLVADHALRLLEGPEEPAAPILVGSEAWYRWLAAGHLHRAAGAQTAALVLVPLPQA